MVVLGAASAVVVRPGRMAAESPPLSHATNEEAATAIASAARAVRRRRTWTWWQPYGDDMGPLVSTCVWRATPEVVLALDGRFGAPHDAYVNGSQVWLADNGPGSITLEWRLHPVARYRRPPELGVYELFETTAQALATGGTLPAPLDRLWDGLEAFTAYGGEVEPAVLAAACTDALGIPPDAAGLVDHDRIGDEWERTRGGVSIVDALFAQLATGTSPA